MKPFYSVLYLKSESISDEKIAVGMFLNADNKPVFDYSKDKLRVAAKIIDSDAVESIERTLINIKKKVNFYSKDKKQLEAFDIEPFTSGYFDYLNRYSNNLLIYSKPSENMGDFRDDDFTSLFKLLIDANYGIVEERTISFKEKAEKRLKTSKVSERLDIKYRISKNKVKSIFSSKEVDYIGVNDSIYSGNIIDTDTDHYVIENKVYQLRALIDGLLDLAKSLQLKNKGHHILYYNEPEGHKQKEVIHDLLEDDTSPFLVKTWDKFEEEEKIIEEHGVGKFSAYIAKHR
ncbi:MAG: hypothetical protein WD607_08465 [Candidatus Paceibacterota bacterium]